MREEEEGKSNNANVKAGEQTSKSHLLVPKRPLLGPTSIRHRACKKGLDVTCMTPPETPLPPLSRHRVFPDITKY